MLFGGIQKTSLIDYPGRIGCVLFTPGCNFTCPYCHNAALAQNRMDLLSPLEETEVIHFLEQRKGLLEAVVITGGEPTLHPDLASFCEEIKQLGYLVKLDTNGSNPERLADLLNKGLVDYVAMDVKTDPDRYPPVFVHSDVTKALASSIRTILSSGLPHEFRTTCLSPFVDFSIIGRIAAMIEGADLYALQRFKDGDVLGPEYLLAHTARISDEDLMNFQSIASPLVKKCIVR